MVWVIVGLEGGKQSLSILFSLLLHGDDAGRWRGAAQIIDVPMQGKPIMRHVSTTTVRLTSR